MMEQQTQCMVIDSQSETFEALQYWFASQDSPVELYHAQTVDDARDAIDRLTPQIILIDIDDAEGQLLCGELKSNPQFDDMLVCGLSDGWDPQSLASALFQPNRADFYLRRPIDGVRLEQILSTALEKSSLEGTAGHLVEEASLEFSELKKRYDAAKSQNLSQQEELDQLRGEIQKIMDNAKAVSAEIGMPVQNDDGEVVDYSEHIGALTSKLHDGHEELNRVREKLDAQVEKHTALENEYGELYKDHQELTNNFERYRLETEESQVEHRDLLAEYATLYDDHFEQNEELEGLRHEIGGLKAAHEDLNTALFDAQQRLVALQVEHVSVVKAKEEADISAKSAHEELSVAQESMEQLRHYLAEVEIEKHSILAAHGQTETSHLTLQEELEQLSEDLQNQLESNEYLQSELVSRAQELEQTTQLLDVQVELNQEFEREVEANQEKIDALETENLELDEKINELTQTLENLKDERESLNNALTDSKSEQNQTQLELKLLQEEHADLEQEYQRSKLEHNAAEENLETQLDNNLSLQEELEQVASSLQEAQTSSVAAFEKVDHLNQAITERDGKIESLQKELADLYKQQAEVAEETKEATARFASFETEQGSRLSHLEETLAERNQKIAQQSAHIDQIEAENITMAADQASQSAELFDRANRIRDLEHRLAELDALQSLIERVYEEQEGQRQQLHDALNSREQMANGIQEIEDQLSYSRMEVEDLHNTMSDLQDAHLEEIDQLNKEMATERASLRQSVDFSQQRLAELEAQYNERNQQYKTLNEEHQEAQKSNGALRDQNSVLKESEVTLRSELKLAQESQKLAQRQLETLAAENAANAEEITSLKSIHQSQKQQYLEQTNQLNKLHSLFLESLERQQNIQGELDAQNASLKVLNAQSDVQKLENAELDEQLKAAKSELEELQEQIVEQVNEIERLRESDGAQLKDVVADLEAAQVQINSLESQLQDANLQVAEAQAAEANALRQSEELQNAQTESNQKLEAALVAQAEAEQKAETAQSAKADAEEKALAAQTAQAEADQKAEVAQAAQVEAEQRLDSVQTALTEAEQQLKNAQAAQVVSEQKVETAQAAQADAEQQVETAQAALADAEQKVLTIQAALADAEQRAETIQVAQSDAADAALTDAIQKAETAQAAQINAEQSLELAKTAQADAEQRAETAESALVDAEQKVETIQAELAAANQSVETAQAALSDADGRAESAQSALSEAERQAETAKAALADAEGRAEAAQEAQSVAEQRAAAAETALADVEQNTSTAESAVDDAMQKANAALEAKAESDRKLEGLQLFLEKLQSEQQMLSTDKENLERQLEDARQQNTAFENEKTNDTRRSELLKSRFDALQALHDAQEASFENERAELQQQINSLQSQINSNYVDNDGAQGATIQSSPDIAAQLSAAEASRLELQNALNDVTQTHQKEKDALLAEVLELQQQLEEARAKAVSNRPQEQLRDDAATDQAPLDAEPVMGQSDASENSLLQIEALQNELAQLGDELKRRESEHTQTLRHMNKAHEADYEELSEQLSVAQSQTQQKNTQVTELEKRVETLENDLEAAKAAGGQPKSEIFAPERQHKALLMHLERAEADLDDAEEQIEQLEAELEQKEAELQNIKLIGPSSLPSGNEGSSSELVRLQQQLQEIEQENMIELDSKVKALEEAKIQIQQLREGGERAAILEDLLSNTQSENNVLLAENDDLQDEIAQLRESLLRARSENEFRTEDPIPEFQSSLGKPEEQLQVLHEEYQSELRKAAEQSKKAQYELSQAYETKLYELKERHAAELAHLQEANMAQQAQIEDQFAAFNDVPETNSQTMGSPNDQSAALSSLLSETEQRLSQMELEREHLLSDKTHLESQIEAMGRKLSENVELYEAYEGAQRDISAMSEMIVQLESDLKKASQGQPQVEQEALKYAEARADALERELKQVQAKLNASGGGEFAEKEALQNKISELEHAQRIAESTRRDIIQKAKSLKERASSTIENLKKELDDAQVQIAQLESRVRKDGSSEGNLSDNDDDFDWNW